MVDEVTPKESKYEMANRGLESAPKEWRRPELRKLPIAATATQDKETGNEGGGEGKGDAGLTRIS